MYKDDLRALLSPVERALFKELNTPNKIQDYLDRQPQNFSYDRHKILRSPRRVAREGKAYCIEAAIFAAAALAYHGREPWLLDLRTIDDDEDHVVALFKKNGLWGAISKTNYMIVKWRDPVYKSVRELAMSYFNEFYLYNREKSMKDYSKPFDLRKYKPAKWVIDEEPLEWLAEALDDSPHLPVVPRGMLKKMRKVSKAEVAALGLREWKGNKRIY